VQNKQNAKNDAKKNATKILKHSNLGIGFPILFYPERGLET
jgi:hypothetical protein